MMLEKHSNSAMKKAVKKKAGKDIFKKENELLDILGTKMRGNFLTVKM
jgi:hypothetical protein